MKLLLTNREGELGSNTEMYWAYKGSTARKAGGNL